MKYINQKIKSSEGFDYILDNTLQIAIKLVGAERGFIALTEEDGKILWNNCVSHHIPLNKKCPDKRYYSHSTVLRAIEKRENLFISNTKEATVKLSSDDLKLKFKSILCSPLLFEDQLIGVISLDSRNRMIEFREPIHPSIFAILGKQLSLAIKNVKLNSQLRYLKDKQWNKLQESEKRYYKLVEFTPEAMAVYGKGEFVYANPAMVKLLGATSQKDILGKSISEIISNKYWKTHEAQFHQQLNAGLDIHLGEEEFIRLDGTKVDVDVTTIPLTHEGYPAIQIVATDISERKRAEKERDQLNRVLMDKNKELKLIISVASHDLRSPLVNIQGFSMEMDQAMQDINSVLNNRKIDKQVKAELRPIISKNIPEALHYIQTSTTKMDSLINGLLRISRLGQAAISLKQLNIEKIFSDILKTFQYQIEQSGTVVQVEKLPACCGDENQINQVFSNLMDNAIKFLDPKRPGMIRITGDKTAESVVYCVKDNGVGIDPKNHERIYEIFHRLDPPKSEGEGLGLTIVRRILDRHGGKIWVESEPDRGSKFFISLPNQTKFQFM